MEESAIDPVETGMIVALLPATFPTHFVGICAFFYYFLVL